VHDAGADTEPFRDLGDADELVDWYSAGHDLGTVDGE
jgi:hypothetical protein